MRGTGHTTRQMKNAARGAAFIWCNNALGYPKSLAMKLGRDDLEIFGLSILGHGADRLRGREFPELILDHAAELSGEQFVAFGWSRTYCSLRKAG